MTVTWLTWALVGAGALVGAPVRFVIDRAVTDRFATATGIGLFPWGLLVVNATGSAVAGAVLSSTTGDLRVLLLTGLCGAFTTFSGFGWEADRLWDSSRRTFWWAVLVMPAACIAAFLVAWRTAAILVA